MKKKLVVFTHNDLDGVSCALLGKIMSDSFMEKYTDYEYHLCGYNNINNTVNEFFDNLEKDTKYHVFITDISVNEIVAKRINEHLRNDPERKMYLHLYDHHETSKWLSREYSWVTVTTDLPVNIDSVVFLGYHRKLTSGTELFFLNEVMTRTNNVDIKANLIDFVELVRCWDTWDWKRDNNLEAKRLNNFFGMFEDKDEFISNFYNKIVLDKENFKLLSDKEIEMLDNKQKEIEDYIQDKIKDLVIVEGVDDKYTVGRIVLDKPDNVSELGSYINDNYNVDFVALMIKEIDKVSLRAPDDNDINVSEIAKRFGGGGHKKAAGCNWTEETNLFLKY